MTNTMQLDKLEAWLKDNGYEDSRRDENYQYGALDWHQIVVYEGKERKERLWDAVCHRGSYGYEKGLIEILGKISRTSAGYSVEGWLTAEDVIERVKAYEEVRG